MPNTALKQTLFNGPIPGSEKKLFVCSYVKGGAVVQDELDLFMLYDCSAFTKHVCAVALECLQIGQEERFDNVRLKTLYRPANKNWWGQPLSAALKKCGIINTGMYVNSKIRSCKGGRTPVIKRIK
jgi:hypothetical protein